MQIQPILQWESSACGLRESGTPPTQGSGRRCGLNRWAGLFPHLTFSYVFPSLHVATVAVFEDFSSGFQLDCLFESIPPHPVLRYVF